MSVYHTRLDNLFAKYAPEKRPLVATILEKYKGKEEEIIKNLVKKFGPEPTASPHASNSSRSCTPQSIKKALADRNENSYRERLIRFYSKYAPKKLSTVDETLEKFSGREEELFFALVKRYGPCPSTSEVASMSMGDASDTLSTISRSTASGSSRLYDVNDVRWRITRLFMAYAPEKIVIVDQMLDTYAGREEEMMARCVERLGPEPPSPNLQTPRERLSRFLEHYMPDKTSRLEPMLLKYGNRIESLFGTLVNKFGPEPPPPFPSSEIPKFSYRQRLIRFYKVYARERLANIEVLLRRYKGNEEEMFRILVDKYGPEPDPDVDPDAPLPPEKNYRARLSRFFLKYDPERVESVPSLLVKYKGREQDIIESLTQKLGPEPPLDAPVDLSRCQVEKLLEGLEDAAATWVDKNWLEGSEDMNPERVCLNTEGNKGKDNNLETFFRQLRLPLSAYRKYAVDLLGEERLTSLERKFGIPCKMPSGGNIEEKPQGESEPLTTTTTTTLSSIEGAKVVDRDADSSSKWDSVEAENANANFSCLLLILECVDFPISDTYIESFVFRRYPLCTLLSERDRFTLQIVTALKLLQSQFDEATQEIYSMESMSRERLSLSFDSWKHKNCKREGKEDYTKRLLARALEILPDIEAKEREEWESVERIEFMGKSCWFQRTLNTEAHITAGPLTFMRRRKLQRSKSLDATLDSPASLRTPLRHFASSSSSPFRANSYMAPLLRYEPLADQSIKVKEDAPSINEYEILPSNIKNLLHHKMNSSPLPTNPNSLKQSPLDVLKCSDPRARNSPPTPVGSTLKADTLSRELRNVNRSGRDKWGPTSEGRFSNIVPPPPRSTKEAIMLNDPLPTGFVEDSDEDFRNVPFFFKGER